MSRQADHPASNSADVRLLCATSICWAFAICNRVGQASAFAGALFVICLKGVGAGGEGRAVGQIGKGAGDLSCRGITNRAEHCAGSQPLVRNWREAKLRAALDGDAIRDHLVCSGSPGVELVDTQFAALFHSLLTGWSIQVALPAKERCCAAKNNSAAATKRIHCRLTAYGVCLPVQSI